MIIDSEAASGRILAVPGMERIGEVEVGKGCRTDTNFVTAPMAKRVRQPAFRTREVDLADLPRWTSWPARLLGLEQAPEGERTLEKIDREYDKDKYARCLDYAQGLAREELSPETVRMFEQGAGHQLMCACSEGELIAVTAQWAMKRYRKIFLNAMRATIRDVSVVIELGCGYGYNLWALSREFPGKRFVGGDYSENAVQLAALLFKAHPEITISRLNLYSPKYELLEDLGDSGSWLIYTVHAVEQLASAAPVLKALEPCRDRIRAVFHFEPASELHDDSLLGLLRLRYAEVNDYNRDLVSRLRERSDICVVQLQQHVFGANPLNPFSVIQWKFAGR